MISPKCFKTSTLYKYSAGAPLGLRGSISSCTQLCRLIKTCSRKVKHGHKHPPQFSLTPITKACSKLVSNATPHPLSHSGFKAIGKLQLTLQPFKQNQSSKTHQNFLLDGAKLGITKQQKPKQTNPNGFQQAQNINNVRSPHRCHDGSD